MKWKPTGILFFSLFLLFFVCHPMVAQAKKSILDAAPALTTAAGKAGIEQTTVTAYSGQVIKGILSVVGILFFILMVYAGFRWMTARGEEDSIKKAKQTIIGAVIGLAIIISSYALTNFVTERIIKGNANEAGNTDFSNVDYATNGCCFDKVRHPSGNSSELRATTWQWRVTTYANCEEEGENPHSDIDAIYGSGTWYFYDVDSADQCAQKYDMFCESNDCYDLSF